MPALSQRFDEALQFAASIHRQQMRKGTTIPYITHLMAVSSIVGEAGGDEDLMIAGLLHDSIEDQGVSRGEIARRFGERVASLVEACSDSNTIPKPPWKQRKERYIAHLQKAGPDVRFISVADKLHNARSILTDLKVLGSAVWDRFNASRDDILWYYRSVISALREGWTHLLVQELEQVVDQIERLSESARPAGSGYAG
ncbi:MAG: metal dependent phosphohydrolase [Rhodocyclaceae bacterium]|nr:MAG: metal dependent phosphohydrolase [Rhodocyclaceae bacterium]